METLISLLSSFGVIVIVLASIAASAIKIVQEYERGVIFRLGRLVGPKGPGLFLIIPIVDRMVKVDLRTVTLDVPAQEVITRDNVTIKVNAVVYFRVIDPMKAGREVEDHPYATSQLSQTMLRSILGQAELDELPSERERTGPLRPGDPTAIRTFLPASRTTPPAPPSLSGCGRPARRNGLAAALSGPLTA